MPAGEQQEQQEQRPILFLGVDGPLNPFKRYKTVSTDKKSWAYQNRFTAHAVLPQFRIRDFAGRRGPVPKVTVRLCRDHGPRLLELGYDIVWATSWQDDANEIIAPLVGLPELPVVHYDDSDITEVAFAGPKEIPARRSLHPLTEPLLAYAAGRPFTWLMEDEPGPLDYRYVREVRQGGTFAMLKVLPWRSLDDLDFELLTMWAEELSQPVEGAQGSLLSDPDENRRVIWRMYR